MGVWEVELFEDDGHFPGVGAAGVGVEGHGFEVCHFVWFVVVDVDLRSC